MSDRPEADVAPTRATRCWTLVTDDGALDVELTAHDGDHLGAVVAALGRAVGLPVKTLWTASQVLPEDLPIAAPALAHGAVLGLDRPVPRSWRADRSSALELRVVGGPDAGRTVPLGQGQHVLGRGAEATVRLDDPDVSRRHVAVRIGGGEITVEDLGSTNGSRLDSDELGPEPRTWPPGAVLRLGATAVTVAGPGGSVAAIDGRGGGRTRLRPTPWMSAPPPEVEIAFPQEPTAAPHRRLAWVAIALPALAGVAMSLVLHTPTFLFFALLSPVVALATWLSDRWSGRRAGRRDRAAYAVELLAAEESLAAAVLAHVRAVEAVHPDLAAITTAARRRSDRLWSRRLGDDDALSVRLGSGPGTTGVTRVRPGGARHRAQADHLAATLDLRTSGGLGVVGPRRRTVAVLSSVIAQLAALHPPGDVEFLLLTTTDRLADWVWAKWLPHLDPAHIAVADGGGASGRHEDEALNRWLAAVTGRRRAAGSRRPGPSGIPSPTGWLVVVVDRPLDAKLAATLRAAGDAGVLTLAAAEVTSDLPVTADATLRLTGETGDVGVLSRQFLPDREGIVLDRLSTAAAAAFSRDLAGLAPAASAGSLPATVRLLELPIGGVHVDPHGHVDGTWARERDRLVATLGRSAEGPVDIDLCRQGPHALIAGTTGSGKSELLQTLIAGLALRHPPDRCSFLLVDYKGGSAFAEAAELPHTVGLVTDLDGQATARALRSLTAELARREAILAAHHVADIGVLPDHVAMARLVIVVDEFATLAEELPGFVPGLVSIAQRGRSLGVHLILATQRPAGVVSPEIRANCTLRICLRTTDEADSRDVLGGSEAAHLPLDQPGRAYLRAGSGEPTALQVARVAMPPSSVEAVSPEVRRWTWPMVARLPDRGGRPGEASDLARLAHALTLHAASSGMPTPHRPWRPPLADELFATALGNSTRACPPGSTRLKLGLVDFPDRQTQEALELDLAEGGGWLAVGGPRSGRTTLLRTVLGEAVWQVDPAGLHVHVIDASSGGLAEEAARLAHTGTSIIGPDALRTVRLVDRLAREVADRRAASAGASAPLILLLIDGVDTVSALLDEADPARGSAALLRLVRDGAAVGVTCVLTADRAVPGGRLAAAARQRIVLPMPDRADYAMSGIAARSVPAHRPPGRALVGEDAWECQLALPRPPAAPQDTRPRVAGAPLPLRIAELAADPVLPLPRVPAGTEQVGGLALPVGPGGDDGAPLVVSLTRNGGLLVIGPPASGRSSALDAFARHLGAMGAPLLRIGEAPAGGPATDLPAADWLDPEDVAGTTSWLAERSGRPCVVIADDIGAPAEEPALMSLPTLGSSSGVVLLAAGTAGQFAGHYQGPVAHLRRARTGLLLCPGTGDADVLGLRLPRTPLPVRPGSGWLAAGNLLERIQVARRREEPDRPPAR
ncbi:MAG: domain containing protein [Blastococcus sp.]|nr:domain containing protein [Blastococcus sp.]